MSIFNIFKRVVLWYQNKFVAFVELNASTEHTYISKRMWEMISSDCADANEYSIFFEKYPNTSNNRSKIAYRYRFFVNTDVDGIKTPDGEKPYTCQLQISRFGHMGFQCVQPTPIEILTEYNIADADFCMNRMDYRVRLSISKYYVNGHIAYEVNTKPILIHHK